MTNSTAVEFYSTIRKDPAVIAHLASAPSEESLIERIKDEGAKRGIALSEADIRQGFDHLDAVVHQAAGEGELTEKELEIVSGGTCFSAFVAYPDPDAPERRGKKWGSYITHKDGSVYYYNATGCRTDKDTFLKMNG
jgi:hypothetical protein